MQSFGRLMNWLRNQFPLCTTLRQLVAWNEQLCCDVPWQMALVIYGLCWQVLVLHRCHRCQYRCVWFSVRRSVLFFSASVVGASSFRKDRTSITHFRSVVVALLPLATSRTNVCAIG